jgi:hypothetical protein
MMAAEALQPRSSLAARASVENSGFFHDRLRILSKVWPSMPAVEPASSRAGLALRSLSRGGRRSLPLCFVSSVCRFANRCRRLRGGRQQLHQPGVSHVLQELIAEFLNGLVGVVWDVPIGVVGGDELLV